MASEIRTELLGLLGGGVKISADLTDKIAAPGSVAVHVRRTDFLNISAHQVCGADYYRNAMEKMRGLVPNARFHIFSDDPEWCRATFTESNQEVIHDTRMAANPLHDLHLMSLAPHHIIANSSYSWWTAWLGEKPDQQVIIPDRWFSGGINAPIDQKAMPHWTPIQAGKF